MYPSAAVEEARRQKLSNIVPLKSSRERRSHGRLARASSLGEPFRRPSITKPELAVPIADALIFICRPTSSSSSGSCPTTSRRIPATAAVMCTSNGQSLASVTSVRAKFCPPHVAVRDVQAQLMRRCCFGEDSTHDK